jgi:hypothetical protein
MMKKLGRCVVRWVQIGEIGFLAQVKMRGLKQELAD